MGGRQAFANQPGRIAICQAALGDRGSDLGQCLYPRRIATQAEARVSAATEGTEAERWSRGPAVGATVGGSAVKKEGGSPERGRTRDASEGATKEC